MSAILCPAARCVVDILRTLAQNAMQAGVLRSSQQNNQIDPLGLLRHGYFCWNPVKSLMKIVGTRLYNSLNHGITDVRVVLAVNSEVYAEKYRIGRWIL